MRTTRSAEAADKGRLQKSAENAPRMGRAKARPVAEVAQNPRAASSSKPVGNPSIPSEPRIAGNPRVPSEPKLLEICAFHRSRNPIKSPNAGLRVTPSLTALPCRRKKTHNSEAPPSVRRANRTENKAFPSFSRMFSSALIEPAREISPLHPGRSAACRHSGQTS